MIDSTQLLLRTLLDDGATNTDLRTAAKSFLQAADHAPLKEAEQALRTLGEYLGLEEPSRAGLVALVCGALVERGCDPAPIAKPLTQRLGHLLELAGALAAACQARLPQPPNEEQDPDETFEALRNQIAPTLPAQNAAWDALQQFWPPAIAMFSASPELRAEARPLCDLAAKLAPHHSTGHWLRFMLSVLDREAILVLEPASKLGMLARISGVADNFQLNVLLMDAFPKPGLFSRRRVPQTVADIAHGLGPQQSDEIVTGVWNLYAWQAVQPGGALPDPKDLGSDKCWIWNEGVPADIPVFDGRRVILLGPPSYPRTWRAQRLFDKLSARLESERTLSKAEVTQWLERLGAAPRSSGA